MNKLNANVVGANCVRPNYKGMNQNKGITLIALIITIIVMLILVGVTVNVALNGGLFTKADEAKEGTQKAADEEELQLEILTAYNEKTGKVELSTLKTNLENKGWKDVTISGDKLTCTSPKVYKFTVLSDGKIEEGGSLSGGENPVIADELKKYILGEDGKGRNLFEILDGETFTFLQDPEDLTSTMHQKVKMAYADYDEETEEEIWHIRYNRDVYKFKFEQIEDENSEHYEEVWTVPEGFGIVNITEGNLGKYVEYAGNTWIVLRDDASGVELITANTTEDEITLEGSDFDIARISYNNAVATLVEECKKATGLEIEGDVIGIRCVGGPAEDETEDTDTIDISKPFEEFTPNESLCEKYSGKNLKIEDDNYLEDYNQMKKIGILFSDNKYEYLIASRFINGEAGSNGLKFGVGYVSDNSRIDVKQIGAVRPDGIFFGGSSDSYLRPVVTLTSGILRGATEKGTIDDPIILN